MRPLARWRVHPNWVTAVSIAATFAAVPLFAAGHWLLGLTLAYGMSLLDSVDGKLARLTFTSSRLGGVLDHGLDMVHPPLWYLAWAWALGGGQVGSLPFRLALLMTGVYVVDRVIAAVFRARTEVSIHDCTPLDAQAAHLHLAPQREHRALHAGARARCAAARPRRASRASTSSWAGRWSRACGTPSASRASGTPACSLSAS